MNKNEVYASPEADLIGEEQLTSDLASRGARLGAVIIDGLLLGVLVMAPLFGLGIWSVGEVPSPTTMVLMALVYAAGYILLNGYLLHKNGQTLGKKILNIKVVRLNGEQATFSRLVYIRWLIFLVLNNIPVIGGIIGIIDALFIFGREQRCLHDRLADTKVVKAV